MRRSGKLTETPVYIKRKGLPRHSTACRVRVQLHSAERQYQYQDFGICVDGIYQEVSWYCRFMSSRESFDGFLGSIATILSPASTAKAEPPLQLTGGPTGRRRDPPRLAPRPARRACGRAASHANIVCVCGGLCAERGRGHAWQAQGARRPRRHAARLRRG